MPMKTVKKEFLPYTKKEKDALKETLGVFIVSGSVIFLCRNSTIIYKSSGVFLSMVRVLNFDFRCSTFMNI